VHRRPVRGRLAVGPPGRDACLARVPGVVPRRRRPPAARGRSEAASDDDDPAPIDYDASPYGEYFDSEGFGLAAHRGTDDGREWTRDGDLRPKTAVLGVEIDGTARGFPLPRVLDAGGVVQTTVGDRPVLVVATEAGEVHGFADPGYRFDWTEAGLVADGTTWDPATGRAADGRRLDRLPTRRLFAFAWQDDHGHDAFYDPA
jgi:hypothetical protein